MKKARLEIIPTKSSTYFLPLVDNEVKFEYLSQLCNSYVANNEEENAFSVLYKWSGKPDFIDYEKRLMNHSLYLGHEDYDEYVLYKFKLTQNMKENLKLFINGKYSLYDNEDKNKIVNFIKKRGFNNFEKIKKILNRDNGLRLQMEIDIGSSIDINSELSSSPDMEKEIFSNFVHIINYKPEE